MAEAPDRDSKTEEPSEKKVSDAIRKGDTPHSREAAVLASVLAMLIVATFQIASGGAGMARTLMIFLEKPGQWRLEGAGAVCALLEHVAAAALLFLAPVLTVFVVAALVASLSQNAPRIVPRRIRPQAARISPRKGLQRMFGARGWAEFLKAVFKFLAVSVVVSVLLRSEAGRVMQSVFMRPAALPGEMRELVMKLLSAVALVALVLAAADLAWSRRFWWRSLRMTRQEVRDERKELDGDPIVKARRLSLARDRLRRSMMAAVPSATVVVANPTHYSVALRYRAGEDAAPVVVARGMNLIALKIREIAAENGVPVVENKALARALYRQVEVDQMIPEEFYSAVAEIIHYVSSGAAARPAP